MNISPKKPDPAKKYGILGIPWDEDASHGRPGSRFAPESIRRNASWIFDRIIDNEVMDLEEFRVINFDDAEVKDFGDVEICSYDHFETKDRIEKKCKELHKANYIPVILGGDCSVSWPQVKALHDCVEGNVGIIHFDGHLDLLDSTPIQGEFSHSSSIRRAIELLPRVDPKNVVQIGCRCYNYPYYYDYIVEKGITEISPRDFYRLGIEGSAKLALEKATQNTEALFITIDIDMLEGIFAPGSGANETGGFNTYELQETMKILAPYAHSFNITEVNPAYDLKNEFSSIAAAKLMFDFIVHNYKPTERALSILK